MWIHTNSASGGAPAHRRVMSRNTKKNIFIAGMLLIPVVHFIVFWIGVNFNSILLAFQKTDAAGKIKFTFDNFTRIPTLFSKGGELLVSLENTLITWAFLTVFLLPWAFTLTYFLYKKVFLSGFFRTMLFIPTILPAVAMTSIFAYLIMPDAPFGAVLTKLVGNPSAAFLYQEKYARWTIVGYIFWTNFGGSFILLSGAMSRIPKEVLESARIDGAGMRVEMLRIVLPLCWPTVSMLILMNVASLFTVSGPILLLTKGRNNSATLSYWFFDQINGLKRFNITSAAGLVFTAVLFPIVLLTRWGLGKVYANVEF